MAGMVMIDPNAELTADTSSDAPATGVEFMVRRLRRIRETEGVVPSALIKTVADLAGCSERTVYRWVQRGTTARKVRETDGLDPALRILYFELGGSVARVVRHCEAHGLRCPPRSTLDRLLRRSLTPGERAYARGGEAARRATTIRMKVDVRSRNDVWEADHKELGVLVMPPRGAKPCTPWMTSFMDAKSRAICGLTVSLIPTAGDVLAALRQSVSHETGDLYPAHGVPCEVHWDNGMEFLAGSVTEVAGALGALPIAMPAYSPQSKGKIERFHRTLDDEFLATLPHYQGGPRGANNKLYGPGEHLHYEVFVELLLEWVRTYNFERQHSSLGGLTPAAVWTADTAPIRAVAEDELRWLALPTQRRRISAHGIHHKGLKYVHPAITSLFGEVVEIRYHPHDQRWIDVFRDGKYLCQAKPSDALTADEYHQVLANREAERRRAANARRAASRRQATRLAGLSKPGDRPEITSVISRADAHAAGELRRDRDAEPKAKPASRPDLNRPWTPPTTTKEL